MRKLGKKTIHIKKYTPGFIVNKIQTAINSAVFTLLLQNIANPEEIDVAVKTTLGIRLPIVGVVQNLDFVGLDVISDFLKNIGLELSIIKECTEKGFLGIKTSQGIFNYGKRDEHVILKQHDEICLKNLEYFEKNIGFDIL
ncbi:MAG: 3-hydroxyacyl-CoA dehydrogenase family protein [Candidatus Hermodarchaeota archaeon]